MAPNLHYFLTVVHIFFEEDNTFYVFWFVVPSKWSNYSNNNCSWYHSNPMAIIIVAGEFLWQIKIPNQCAGLNSWLVYECRTELLIPRVLSDHKMSHSRGFSLDVLSGLSKFSRTTPMIPWLAHIIWRASKWPNTKIWNTNDIKCERGRRIRKSKVRSELWRGSAHSNVSLSLLSLFSGILFLILILANSSQPCCQSDVI